MEGPQSQLLIKTKRRNFKGSFLTNSLSKVHTVFGFLNTVTETAKCVSFASELRDLKALSSRH